MNENKQNPYAAPKAKLERFDFAQAYASFKPFSGKGRIGRLRYISYTLGVFSIALIIAFFIAPIPIIGTILSFIIFVASLVIILMLSMQRCHDFNATAWLAFIFLIPLVSLALYFIPGTKGDNKYGLEPPENSVAVVVSSILLMIIYGLSTGSLVAYLLIGSV